MTGIQDRMSNEQTHELKETLRALISYGQTDLIAIDCCTYVSWIRCCPPEAFEFVLDQELVEGYIKNFEDLEILSLVEVTVGRYMATPSEIWKRCLKRILGMTLHICDAKFGRHLMLNDLPGFCKDPVESRAVADLWLEAFQSSGADIHNFLLARIGFQSLERLYCPYCCHCTCQIVVQLEETPSIYWDWWIDPEHLALLVCDEFKGLCYYQGCDPIEAYERAGGYGFRTSHDPSKSCLFWPYSCPNWCSEWQIDEQCWDVSRRVSMKIYLKNGWSGERERKRFIEQVNNRFERRMHKKAAKQRKAMGFGRDPRMPGVWIE